jgi:hypothetical protein
MKNENQEVLIKAQGSLAVLALGSVGIKKWRQMVRKREQKKQEGNGDEKNAD